MKITLEFLTDSFNKFNTMYFNGELITPSFEVSHTKTALGDFRNNGFGSYRIRLSDYYVREQKDIEQTLLHEMIHQYQRQILNERGHGYSFKKKAEEINRKGGYSISRTTSVENCKVNGIEKIKKASFKEYNVAIYKNRNGRWFSFVMASNRVNIWLDTLAYNSTIKAYFTFKTCDDKFAKYPSCRKLCRGMYITEEEANFYQKEYNCEVFEKWTARRKAI